MGGRRYGGRGVPFVTEEERSERREVISWEEGEERRRRVRKEVYQERWVGVEVGSRREGWTVAISEKNRGREGGDLRKVAEARPRRAA